MSEREGVRRILTTLPQTRVIWLSVTGLRLPLTVRIKTPSTITIVVARRAGAKAAIRAMRRTLRSSFRCPGQRMRRDTKKAERDRAAAVCKWLMSWEGTLGCHKAEHRRIGCITRAVVITREIRFSYTDPFTRLVANRQ